MGNANQKNQTVAYATVGRAPLEVELEQAIKNNDLKLKYQPLVDVKGQVKAYECFLRWDRKELGKISPCYFLSIAKKSDLISKLENWVIQEACKQYFLWAKKIPIHVNVSVSYLIKDNFIDEIKKTFSCVLPSDAFITIEIEDLHNIYSMDNSKLALEKIYTTMKKCKSYNINFSLDSFNISFFDLDTVSKLDLNSMKIDIDTLTKISESTNSLSIFRSIIDYLKSNNIDLIVHNIETEKQESIAYRYKADLMQGFRFGRPKLPEKIDIS